MVDVSDREPLTKAEAQDLARRLLDAGQAVIVGHCEREMRADGIFPREVFACVRLGKALPYQRQADGTYSYRFVRGEIGTAVTFCWEGRAAVAFFFRTAWRRRRRRE